VSIKGINIGLRNNKLKGVFYEGGVPMEGIVESLEGVMRGMKRLRTVEVGWMEIARMQVDEGYTKGVKGYRRRGQGVYTEYEWKANNKGYQAVVKMLKI
jgi:hypothetical protein